MAISDFIDINQTILQFILLTPIILKSSTKKKSLKTFGMWTFTIPKVFG